MDLSLTKHFTSVFVFLLVFAGVYALLEKSKILGTDKKNINAIIAIVFAFLIITSKAATTFISFVLPWFFILALVILFLIFMGKMFGKTDKDIKWAFSYGTVSPAITWIIIFVVLILVFGFSSIFGQELLEDAEVPEGGSNIEVPVESTSSGTGETAAGSGSVVTKDYGSNVLATFFHPKVMGMLVLFVVGLTAILLITKSGFAPFSR